jgi:hypothetical protein
METYARINQEFTQATKYNPKVCSILKRLAQMDMSIINSFLMAFFKYAEEKSEQDETYLKILSTIESFIFRRLVCSYGTNALNKIFCTLHKDVLKLKSENDGYSDVLIFILLNKKGSAQYPADIEFKQSLLTRNIYSMNSKNKMYLFNRLENRDSKEKVEVIKAMAEGVFSVEHIMPQTLTDQWKRDLGPEHERIYNDWLNSIANLTLTGYNSKYKNRPFIEKRDIKDGFKDSNLRLNNYVSRCEKWGEEELLVRRNELWILAKDLWKYPVTNFEPVVQFPEMHTLDEDFIFKGKTINSFTFLGTQYKVYSWTGMFVEVTKLIYEIDSAPLYQLIVDGSSDLVSRKENWNAQIGDGLYLYTANDTMCKYRVKIAQVHRLKSEQLCDVKIPFPLIYAS